jgi:N-acetylmuramoyl-L-alanine amidase CwlA
MKIVNKKLNIEEFKAYIKGKNFSPNNPNKLVLHHTWRPDEKTWNGQTTINGLKKYYEGLGWSSAPHIFLAPDGIWLFTDMNTQGVHAGEGNFRSIGIEVVGDYDQREWSGQIKEYAVAVIKALMEELKITEDGIKRHADYSSKTCPGLKITKEYIINLIKPMTHEANYKKLAQTLAKFVSYDYGDNPNDDETKEILKKFEKKIKDQKEELKQIDGIAGEYAKQIDSLKIMLKSVEDEYLDTRETISRQDDFVQMQNKKIDELEKEINALKITLDSLREEYSKVVNKLPNKVINEFQLGKWTITISAN